MSYIYNIVCVQIDSMNTEKHNEYKLDFHVSIMQYTDPSYFKYT